MKALSNAMISALTSSKNSTEGILACTPRTGKALEARGLARPYYHRTSDVVAHYQISAAGREYLADIQRTKAALATTAPAVEVGQSYRVGADLHTVTDTASDLRGVVVYRTASNYAKTYAVGEFEAMVADGRAVLLAEQEPAEVVTVTPIEATPAEAMELLDDIKAAQDADRDAAVRMVEAMLTVARHAPASIAHIARAALRMMLAANPGDEITTLALAELDRRHPAKVVTVDGHAGTGLRWHLVDRNGNPVEAGEYVAKWSGGPRFTIAEHPEIQGWTSGGVPLCVWVEWVDVTRGYCEPGELVDGWDWMAERV